MVLCTSVYLVLSTELKSLMRDFFAGCRCVFLPLLETAPIEDCSAFAQSEAIFLTQSFMPFKSVKHGLHMVDLPFSFIPTFKPPYFSNASRISRMFSLVAFFPNKYTLFALRITFLQHLQCISNITEQ